MLLNGTGYLGLVHGDACTDAAGRTGVLPRLRALAGGLHDELRSRWPETVMAAYPALAGPGSARVQVPEWWQPGL